MLHLLILSVIELNFFPSNTRLFDSLHRDSVVPVLVLVHLFLSHIAQLPSISLGSPPLDQAQPVAGPVLGRRGTSVPGLTSLRQSQRLPLLP